ncbi:hypothetical protein [Acetobacter cerevisiae]|uniref:hypothetical protein n=1 Tax=Acetobacter cerevisiae TaxID=178900 RepID=UPI001E28C490|nr:hypothetical protein [Acetobacter cerevisiae]
MVSPHRLRYGGDINRLGEKAMQRTRKERKRPLYRLLVCIALCGACACGEAGLAAERNDAGGTMKTPGGIARCDLTTGRSAFCDGPYSGRAILPQEGAYHLCDVTLGTARFCYGLYTGRAVVRQERGGYARCDLTLGRITFCEGPYTGTAVIPQSAE